MPVYYEDDVLAYDEESVYSDHAEEQEEIYEDEEEIHQNPFGLWPCQENYEWRPNVVHLASLYAPVPMKPEDLPAEFVTKYDTYKEQRRAASHAKSQAEKKLAAKGEELKKAEASQDNDKPKSYASKWSDKAKDGEAKKALVKRLGEEFEVLAESVQKETETISKLDADNQGIVRLIEAHESCVEGYEAYKTFIEGNSKTMYGKAVALPQCH